jgi:hypothetical protein
VADRRWPRVRFFLLAPATATCAAAGSAGLYLSLSAPKTDDGDTGFEVNPERRDLP